MNAYEKSSAEKREEIEEAISSAVDAIIDTTGIEELGGSSRYEKAFTVIWDEFTKGLDLETVTEVADARISSSVDSIKNQGFEVFSTGVKSSYVVI